MQAGAITAAVIGSDFVICNIGRGKAYTACSRTEFASNSSSHSRQTVAAESARESETFSSTGSDVGTLVGGDQGKNEQRPRGKAQFWQ